MESLALRAPNIAQTRPQRAPPETPDRAVGGRWNGAPLERLTVNWGLGSSRFTVGHTHTSLRPLPFPPTLHQHGRRWLLPGASCRARSPALLAAVRPALAGPALWLASCAVGCDGWSAVAARAPGPARAPGRPPARVPDPGPGQWAGGRHGGRGATHRHFDFSRGGRGEAEAKRVFEGGEAAWGARRHPPPRRNFCSSWASPSGRRPGEFQKQNIDFAFVLGGGLCRFRGP